MWRSRDLVAPLSSATSAQRVAIGRCASCRRPQSFGLAWRSVHRDECRHRGAPRRGRTLTRISERAVARPKERPRCDGVRRRHDGRSRSGDDRHHRLDASALLALGARGACGGAISPCMAWRRPRAPGRAAADRVSTRPRGGTPLTIAADGRCPIAAAANGTYPNGESRPVSATHPSSTRHGGSSRGGRRVRFCIQSVPQALVGYRDRSMQVFHIPS